MTRLCAILCLLIAAGATLAVSGAPSAWAADVISAIEIAGNRSVGPETVRSRLLVSKGGPYDAAKVDQSLKALFATGLFSDVRIDRRGTVLVVTVVENPVVGAISFEGASAIDKTKLEAQVQLKPKMRFTEAKAHADAVRLRELYRRQGRLLTTVEPKTADRGSGRVDVVFVIAEGQVTKIDAITFVGNRSFTDAQLRDVISTSQSGWFDILKSAAFYDPERIDHDKDLLRRFYLKNGFPDARVPSAEAVKNADGTGYTVTFSVEEGDRFSFSPATVESSLPGVDTAALEGLAEVKPGARYSEEAISRSAEQMTLALSEQGKPFARVRPVPVRDVAAHTIGVKFRIDEGPRVYVERIDIVGNTRTKDTVIRRTFRVAEGDAVNAVLLERGRQRVKALGFFKSVALKHKTGSVPDRAVVTLEVVEDDTRELSYGVGYSTSEGVVGDISLTERNLLGNGQWLRVKLAGGEKRLQADIGFTEPRFLGTDLSAGFDLLYKDVDYTRQASYKSRKVGGDVRFGYPINDQWSASVNYTLVRNQIYDVGPSASAAIREAAGYPGAASNAYYTSSVGYGIIYDTRDSKKAPSSGVYYTLTQDLAGLGGDVRYIRSVGDARVYYPVSEGITGVGRAAGGIISGWGGQDVRLLDLFYRGSESVRGFAPAGLGPRDMLSANRDALGGKMFYATTAEVLFNIPGVPQDIGLRGAVFIDAGSIWGVNNTAASLPGLAGNTPAMRASVGTGLAWASPIGALRVDYAYPILKQSSDKTQPWSFGLSPF
ncbi:MAG: outer membrane protein assembly factor BamA [Hyphomicrobiaceae bacterium]|nr:MAG: outer membrane protein assembly factor BamA [Hyphomicrobiaceae bacterium]